MLHCVGRGWGGGGEEVKTSSEQEYTVRNTYTVIDEKPTNFLFWCSTATNFFSWFVQNVCHTWMCRSIWL